MKQNRSHITTWVVSVAAVVTLATITMILKSTSEAFRVPQPQITFMSSRETAAFLRKDPENYIQGLTIYDLRARKATSHEHYMQRVCDSARDFTREERIFLERCARQADMYFKDIVDLVHGLDAKAAAAIPWILCKTGERSYENGLPHTRANAVFLSTGELSSLDFQRTIRTLIHEKVHVYQRMYPNKTEQYLVATGYKRLGPRASLHLIRANPDLNPWYYALDGKACWYRYSSEYPDSITDCIKYGASEHPYEDMAYYVAGLYRAGTAF